LHYLSRNGTENRGHSDRFSAWQCSGVINGVGLSVHGNRRGIKIFVVEGFEPMNRDRICGSKSGRALAGIAGPWVFGGCRSRYGYRYGCGRWRGSGSGGGARRLRQAYRRASRIGIWDRCRRGIFRNRLNGGRRRYLGLRIRRWRNLRRGGRNRNRTRRGLRPDDPHGVSNDNVTRRA